jgi:hypothetical protein
LLCLGCNVALPFSFHVFSQYSVQFGLQLSRLRACSAQGYTWTILGRRISTSDDAQRVSWCRRLKGGVGARMRVRPRSLHLHTSL